MEPPDVCVFLGAAHQEGGHAKQSPQHLARGLQLQSYSNEDTNYHGDDIEQGVECLGARAAAMDGLPSSKGQQDVPPPGDSLQARKDRAGSRTKGIVRGEEAALGQVCE